MTTAELAERERREALRAARYEGFCQRAILEAKRGEEAQRLLLERRLRSRRLALKYSI